MTTTTLAANKVKTVNRLDYAPADFAIEKVHLHFQLFEEEAIVTATLTIKRNPWAKSNHLTLNGNELTLLSIEINQLALEEREYRVDEHSLSLLNVPDFFELKTVVRLFPGKNKALSGLYQSAQQFCTQCEPEGFRRITYFLDRPDVLSLYTTRIEAAKSEAPILLSNGNPAERGDLGDGRHYALWHDPFPK